jgi:hypothetical protein
VGDVMTTETIEPAVSWGNDAAYCIPKETAVLLKAQALEPADDAVVHLKLFTPDAGATWWISEWHDEDGEVLLFGLCDLGMGFPELGYVSLNELMSLRGKLGLPVERDLYWTPTLLTEVTAKHGR